MAVGNFTINAIGVDGVINMYEAQSTIYISGQITGGTTPGCRVNVFWTLLNVQYSYDGVVESDLSYNVAVDGSALAAASGSFSLWVRVYDATGTVGLSRTNSRSYTVDTIVSPVGITWGAIAGDNNVSGTEAQSDIIVSGTLGGDLIAGSEVQVILEGSVAATGVINGSKQFAIPVNGDLVARNNSLSIHVLAQDARGNLTEYDFTKKYTGAASTTAGTIVINTIAGDGVINAAENNEIVFVTGTCTGDVPEGSTVTLNVTDGWGNPYQGTTASDKSFSVAVDGAALVAKQAKSLTASVVANNGYGTKTLTSTTKGYTVDLVATASFSVNHVTGDNKISGPEALSDIAISGTFSGEAVAGCRVAVVIDGVEIAEGFTNASKQFSIPVNGDTLARRNSLMLRGYAVDAVGNTATVEFTKTYTGAASTVTGTISMNIVADNGVINAVEANGEILLSGSVTGDFHEGDVVTFNVTDWAGVSYTAPIDASLNYAVLIEGNRLLNRNPLTIVASATANNGYGTMAVSTTRTYTVDVVTSATCVITNFPTQVTQAQVEQGALFYPRIASSGDSVAGDLVNLYIDEIKIGEVSLGPSRYVDVELSAAQLSMGNLFRAEVRVVDSQQNVGYHSGTKTYLSTWVSTPPTLSIVSIAADDVVSTPEGPTNIVVGGYVTGDARPGNLVTVVVSPGQNEKIFTATVWWDRSYSVLIPGMALINAQDRRVRATVTAVTNGELSYASAERTYAVDAIPPVSSIVYTQVGQNNIVPYAEWQPSAYTPVAVKVEGEYVYSDVITVTVGGQVAVLQGPAGLNFQGFGIARVLGSALVGHSELTVTVRVHDISGNYLDISRVQPYTLNTKPIYDQRMLIPFLF